MTKKRRPNLWKAFRDGAIFKLGETDHLVTMSSADAGSIALPSGRIVVSDPFSDPCQPPLTVGVPPGSYTVHLALGNGEVALVMVLFKEGNAAFWERAKPRYVSVDSATACVMDYSAARYLRRNWRSGNDERFIKRFEGALAENGLYGVTSVSANSGSIVVFQTWGGDGTFPLFFGYDSGGDLMCLVIDMLVEPLDAEPTDADASKGVVRRPPNI